MTDTEWNIVEAERRPVDLQELRHLAPSVEGTTELPLGSVIVEPDTHAVLLAYLPYLPAESTRLRAALHHLNPPLHQRTSGLAVRSALFGHTPRHPLRRDWCSPGQINREFPEAYRLLAAQAPVLEETYERIAPGIFDAHAAKAAKVLDDWMLPGSRAFTGGVVNRDGNLGYHHDAGNFTDVFSAMIALRRGVAGGALVLPELGIHLPIADNSATYFDGQGLLHGVSAMRKTARDGYRITAVYYSTHKLWACLPPTEEAARAQKVRTERAQKRAAGAVQRFRV